VTKRFALQTLLDLSQMHMEEAARQLGILLASEKEANARFELIYQYREEYQARFVAAAQNGLGRDEWSNFQSFLARLDEAVAQAREMVSVSQQHTAAGQRKWVEKRGTVKTYDTLAQRHYSREQKAENRREQKALDEHSSRAHHTKDEENE